MTAPAYRIGGRPASREAFYAAACDPRRSVVVEACAGAGKTWMLVSRIVRALLDGTEPQQILAITFTRKAAGDMRARLDDWLRRFAALPDDAARAAELVARGLDADAAMRQAPALAGLHERVLAAARPVQLRTFHAWFAQLVSQAPLHLLERLGLPAGFELLESIDELEPVLMRRFQRRVAADPARRADLAALVARHRRGTVESWLRVAWHRGVEIALADEAGRLDDAVPGVATTHPEWAGFDDVREWVRHEPLRTELADLARQLGAATGVRPGKAAAQLLEAFAAPDAAAAHGAIRKALFTDEGSPRQLGKLPLQEAVCARLEAMESALAQQQAQDDHRRMVALARVLLAEYAALKRARRRVDMSDLERTAHALLSDPQAAGWVQERLDLQLRHLLVDEFQDTSPLQWQALLAWLSGYAGAGGGASGQRPLALFVVGDPKQSIYRFRRAEPRVFEAARQFVEQGLSGVVLECDHTRRNAPAVVEALNAVFLAAQAAQGWGPFRAHSTESAAAGAVLALPPALREAGRADAAPGGWRDSLTEPRDAPDRRRRQAEARRIAAAVAAALAEGVLPKELMVLARRREPLAAVAEELAALQIACVLPENKALCDLPEAADVIALLDALASPSQDLALARALRSPLFGATDEDLLWLAERAATARRPWLRALLAAADPPQTLVRAQALLGRWLAALPAVSPHDLLDRVLHEGELPARLAAAVPPHRRALAALGLRSLVACALGEGAGRHVSVYRFVRELKAGRLKLVDDLPPGAVRLLTVHGAKGLEADHVFITDAEPQARPADRHTLLVDWPAERAAPASVAFVVSEGRVPRSLEPLMLREREARAREELNALYVACTRARLRLVVSATEPHRPEPEPSWWRRLLPHLQAADLPGPAAAGPAAPPRTDEPVYRRRPAEPLPPRPEPVRDARAAALGRAVHRLLEWAAGPAAPLTPGQWEGAARRAAQAFGLASADGAEVRAIAGRIAASADCARFFDPARLRWSGNEVPLAAGGQPLRVDRLVLLDGEAGPEWWVLDYKLHHAPAELEEYRAQLGGYRDALRAAVGPGPAVRAAFVTGAGELVEH